MKGLYPSGRTPGCADHNTATVQRQKSPWAAPTGKKLHSCFSQDPNTPKSRPHPTAGACFPLDLAGNPLKTHSSSLIDLSPFSHFSFPGGLWDSRSSSLTQPSCFPRSPPTPNVSEHTWGDSPGKRHADRAGQSPIFLGSYLNNSCTEGKKIDFSVLNILSTSKEVGKAD